VQVRFRVSGNSLHIRVTDRGAGIAADQLPRLFEPLYTTKFDGERYGLGMGLAMVEQYVTKDFGGSIRVKSSRRHGTNFTATFPVSSLIGD
jgi:signal transduction histidine kinase